MARKRDYRREYEQRQERSRHRGFENYYEERTRESPGAPRPEPEELARRRGHRSRADFLAALRPGDLILCDIGAVKFNTATGRFGVIWKTVIPAAADGVTREFSIRNQTRASLRVLIEQEAAKEVEFSRSPSMDQRRLLSHDDVEGGY